MHAQVEPMHFSGGIMLEVAGLAVMTGTIVVDAVILWKFVRLFE
jgi:hypothetical protein